MSRVAGVATLHAPLGEAARPLAAGKESRRAGEAGRASSRRHRRMGAKYAPGGEEPTWAARSRRRDRFAAASLFTGGPNVGDLELERLLLLGVLADSPLVAESPGLGPPAAQVHVKHISFLPIALNTGIESISYDVVRQLCTVSTDSRLQYYVNKILLV